jgi:cyclase
VLKKRIVPKLLIQHKSYGRIVRPVLVTTRNYERVFEVGDPLSQAKIYEAQLADELLVLNIERVPIAKDEPLLRVIEKLASETFMPISVGGGVLTVEDFALLLERGADKVSINTAAILDPSLVSRAAQRFGAQCVVASIDFRQDGASPTVRSHRATRDTGVSVVDWAMRLVAAGAGEILLTDADRVGAGRGLYVAVGRMVTDSVVVTVIL